MNRLEKLPRLCVYEIIKHLDGNKQDFNNMKDIKNLYKAFPTPRLDKLTWLYLDNKTRKIQETVNKDKNYGNKTTKIIKKYKKYRGFKYFSEAEAELLQLRNVKKHINIGLTTVINPKWKIELYKASKNKIIKYKLKKYTLKLI